jgi:tetratricopeptide (TPR) repeat protein
MFLACCLSAEEPRTAEKTAEFLDKAGNAEFRGDYRTAEKYYKKATTLNPADAEAWAAYGEHLRFYAHDYKGADTAFNKALAAPEPNARAAAFALRGLGELAAKEGLDEKAVELFKKSLTVLPLADTHRSLCHLYCRQKNFKAAAEHAGEAVKLNPDDAIAILLYAAQLHRAGEKTEGFKQFEKALSLSGMNAQGEATGPVHCCVFYNAAGYLAVIEDSKRALDMLKRFFKTPNHRHLTREEIESDSDFEKLKLQPEFQKLLKSQL